MTDTNDKVRALFLAAIMVISVFGVTVALTGAAAGEPFADSGADAQVDSGDVYFQGQELYLNVSETGANSVDFDALTVAEVVDVADNDTNFVSDIQVNDTVTPGSATIDTDNLDGRYVILDGNNYVEFSGGTVADNDSTIDDASFQVAVQSLSAEFDDDDVPITEGDTGTIEITSNRGNYAMNITAEGLDEGDLEEIFNQSNENNFVAASAVDDDDDDSVQVIAGTDTDVEANFSVFDDPGSYTFDFEVNDSTATASASVDVNPEDVEIDFDSSIYTEEIGDKVEVTVQMEDTDEAYIYVGGTDVNYLERIHVEDDDDDGEVTIELNTLQMGWDESSGIDGNNADYDGIAGNQSGFEVLGDDVEGDDSERFDTTSIENDPDSGTNTLDDGISSNLNEPIESGDYGLTATSVGDDPFVNDDDELEIPDEEDVATLDLSDRSTDGISIWQAPDDDIDGLDVDDGELDEVLATATETSNVADGDMMIVQAQASGIFGNISEDDNEVTDRSLTNILSDNTDQGITLVIEETDAGPNVDDSELNLDSSNTAMYTDSANNTLWVLVDTGSVSNFDEEAYTAEFRIGDDDEDNSGSADNDDPYEFVYLDSDEEESVEAEFDGVDADAEFDNVVDDEVQVEAISEATVSGTANVAPGEELDIRLRRTDDPAFLMTQEDVVVQSDGTWSTTFDMSGVAVDTTFTATVRRGQDTISDDQDGIVVEEITPTPTPTPTPEPTPTPTPEPTPTPTPEPTPTPTPTPEPTTTDTGGQPGFGIGIALVALLTAGLLAARRRS